jgi:glucuronate isomerase
MTTRADVLAMLSSLDLVDAHTHLVGGRLGARGLHDILLYHMAVSELYAAGCPSGARLTQFPGWPDRAEAHARIREALPFLGAVRNTHISWGIRTLLRDLYGWTEPVTEANWLRLDDLIRERADDRRWQREVLARAGIRRVCTEWARRGQGEEDDLCAYALEWAFFTRCQWGEYDTALYELERCWGKTPESPTPIGAGGRPQPERVIRTRADLEAAVEHYVKAIPADRIVSTATHISTDLDLDPVSDRRLDAALRRRARAGEAERSLYAAAVNERFLTALARHAPHVVFQFSYGAEPLPFETGSRLSQRSIAQVGAMIARHPGLRFQCFLASQHANQSLCTLARELPNLTLVGAWWHTFYPPILRTLIEERLDMLPMNRHIAFFSDAYCVEWAYAKAFLVRQQMAAVLQAKIEQGQYDRALAETVARAVLCENAAGLLRG